MKNEHVEKKERKRAGGKEREKEKNEKERKEGSKGRKKGVGRKKEGQKKNSESDQCYEKKAESEGS